MRKTLLLALFALLCLPLAMAQDSDAGFTLGFRSSRATNLVTADQRIRFTATTDVEAAITIYIDGVQNCSATGTTLATEYMYFTTPGNHIAKAVATYGGKTLTKEIKVVFNSDSPQGTNPPAEAYGVTRQGDSYMFQFAAPEKSSVILLGSWDNYSYDADRIMNYTIDTAADGTQYKRFYTTVPASVTGTEFGYCYVVDGKTGVGDPWARLVLDPGNDKYITSEVYPDMPAYPTASLPSNTVVSWYSDNLLDYNWQTTDFKPANKTDLVIYEMLFRDFTGTEGAAKGNGTVRQAIEKIPYLKSLNINAVELMPINEFNGNNSWGYNPNFYFAIDKAYGTPQDYKEFIDKCHAEGIAVILDVVFNQCDWLHPWYKMYSAGSNPFINATAPHAYSVLNDWNQGFAMVQEQWHDVLRYWLEEYKVDGFRFDLVKGLGNNDSYANSGDAATNAYNQSRIDRMKELQKVVEAVNPNAYFINENLATAAEENAMAETGQLNWANVNHQGQQYAMGYQSESGLERFYAPKDSRTWGSTVSYLESHDEQRLAYAQNEYGEIGVKGNKRNSARRLGAAAAQMILAPGAHMIWQFSEMGNAQNTKNSDGGNNTDPKTVNWNLLNNANNQGILESYKELIAIRNGNAELFAQDAEFSSQVTASNWASGRTMVSKKGAKELYTVINPDVKNQMTVYVKFAKADDSAYKILSKGYNSEPTFSATAGTVTLPANSYVVIGSESVSAVDEIGAETAKDFEAYSVDGGIMVSQANSPVEVYAADGRMVATLSSEGSVSLPSGIYILRSSSTTLKLIVR